MKYESNVLKRLIDTYGVIGNPKYMSEIIKQFIVQGKECFPHLFTYQADWLAHIDEFGLTSDYVVSYTGQQIYAPHSKEKPVKRAILKGNTLVNLFNVDDSLSVEFSNKRWKYQNQVLNLIGGNKYYVYFFNKLNNLPLYIKPINTEGGKGAFYVKANKGIIVTLDSTITSVFGYYLFKDGWTGEESKQDIIDNCKILFLEYQDGMENWNIPYFEGMKSVQMPVLTTSNEDGTKTNILTTPSDLELRGINDVKDELNCLTGELTERVGEVVFDGTENWNCAINSDGGYRFNLSIPTMHIYPSSGGNPVGEMLSNYLPVGGFTISKTYDKLITTWENHIVLYLGMDITTTKELKEYLSQNPLTVQYRLATESIKTVDLTIKDQNNVVVNCLATFKGGTHFYTTSQDGSLLPTLTVDVVTDLAETLNLCSLDGNTM